LLAKPPIEQLCRGVLLTRLGNKDRTRRRAAGRNAGRQKSASALGVDPLDSATARSDPFADLMGSERRRKFLERFLKRHGKLETRAVLLRERGYENGAIALRIGRSLASVERYIDEARKMARELFPEEVRDLDRRTRRRRP